MKNSKMRFVVLLLVIMCMILPLNAMAAITTQHGLEVELTTDRQSYSVGDTILATLKVKNSSGVDFDDVTLENLLPEGCVLSTDSDTSLTSDVKAGETIMLETRYVVEGEIVLPGTGDNSAFAAWCILFVSASVLTVIFKKKCAHGMLALLLCIAMVNSVFTAPFAAAAGERVVLQIEEKASCSDKDVRFSAEVRYILPEEKDYDELYYSNIDSEHIVYDENRDIYYVDNQILLTSVEDAPRVLIEELIVSLGGRTVGAIEITGDYQVEFAQKMTYSQLQGLLDRFESSSLIQDAILHILIPTEYTAIPNDSEWAQEEWSTEFPEGLNWNVEAIDAMGAWNYIDDMSTINVGVIDSAFSEHEDLNYEKIWNNPDVYTDDMIHGTHVSGIIAANHNKRGVAGVAPRVRLFGYSICGEKTDDIVIDSNKTVTGYMEWKYAVANFAVNNCRVINISMAVHDGFNTEMYKGYDRFLTRLYSAGYDFLIVQGAGNKNANASRSGLFVGCTDNRDQVIVVGAIETKGSSKDGFLGILGDRKFNGYEMWINEVKGPIITMEGEGSNWGERVDVVAPGDNVLSAVPGDKKYDLLGGTSMAAPHVSGVAAMCFAVNPGLSAEQVKEIIISTAEVRVSHTIENEVYSYPLVNAAEAVRLAQSEQTDDYELPEYGSVMGVLLNESVSANVVAYRLEDGDAVLTAGSTVVDPDSTYMLFLEPGTYYIYYYEEGFIPHIVANVIVTENQVTYLDDVYLVPQRDQGVGVINGIISDAVTGMPLPDVKLTFYPGWNNTAGTPSGSAYTDVNGMYTATIREGTYTAVVEKERYASGSMNVLCVKNNNDMQNGALSPLQADGQYRVVLTWGAAPEDLDSHLTGALDNGNTMHIYYSDMNAMLNSEKLSDLDVDDVDSYGPETITLYLPDSGSFRYSVHDYTNRNELSSRAMGRSGAKVTVYKGSGVVASYPIPNREGTVWNVFDLENGVIRPVNTMSYTVDPGDVGSLVSTYRMRHTSTYHEDDKDYN